MPAAVIIVTQTLHGSRKLGIFNMCTKLQPVGVSAHAAANAKLLRACWHSVTIMEKELALGIIPILLQSYFQINRTTITFFFPHFT
jgi:hypothetical protein